MEVFVLQTVIVKKSIIVRNVAFAAILALSLGIITAAHSYKAHTQMVKIYFVDAEMLRLIPVGVTIPDMSAEKTAQRVLDELIEGRDENYKIRRFIPKIRRCMTVEVEDGIAYVNIDSDMISEVPDGRDSELLTVYSIVNSLVNIDGIVNVRFTIDGESQKDFKGYLDMRETFIPDYFI